MATRSERRHQSKGMDGKQKERAEKNGREMRLLHRPQPIRSGHGFVPTCRRRSHLISDDRRPKLLAHFGRERHRNVHPALLSSTCRVRTKSQSQITNGVIRSIPPITTAFRCLHLERSRHLSIAEGVFQLPENYYSRVQAGTSQFDDQQNSTIAGCDRCVEMLVTARTTRFLMR